MELNTELYGFYVEKVSFLKELQGEAYELVHKKSGAKVLYVKNEDENKTFSIGFKTIPEDSTGVFHILEHSVLCGSVKYPSKETFVELMKGSMQNFLNAMTFPDKTIYVFSTINEKDYMNLMDVYMDGVFNPLIYEKREIFQQEGWHYEFSRDEEKLLINGVVYNEMKGVFSSVDALLWYNVSKAMFKDNTYNHVFGGDPKYIPSLSYETFLEKHKKYYCTDNSYILLYGKMDVEEKLKFLDEEYLGKLTTSNLDYKIEKQTAINETFIHKYGVEKEESNGYQLALSYNIGSYEESEKIIAVNILLDAIMGNNEAQLKKVILEAGLGEDIVASVNEGILQPYVVFQLRNANKLGEKNFKGLFESTIEKICQEGIDKKDLIAAINRREFILREKNLGVPEGIVCSINSMVGWIHGDEPLIYLKYEESIEKIRNLIDTRYFEELLKSLIINNSYKAYVVMEPDIDKHEDYSTFKDEEEMETLKEELLKDQYEKQKKENGKSEFKPLVPLNISDLKNNKKQAEELLYKEEGYSLLWNEANCFDISYINYYFDLGQLSSEDIPYVNLLSRVLGSLRTGNRKAKELNILCSTWLGSMDVYVDCFTDIKDKSKVQGKLVIAISVLDNNIKYALSIPEEVIKETLFDEKENIRTNLQQSKLYMERSLIAEGNSYATMRVSSYYSLEGVFREEAFGISYYKFLCNILKDYDNNFHELQSKLVSLQKYLVTKGNLIVSYTGKKDTFEEFRRQLRRARFTDYKRSETKFYNKELPKVKNEAFIIPSNVSYVIEGSKKQYSGKDLVIARILSFEYLWKHVRALGGAYGTGMQAGFNGNIILYSYRDPKVLKTYETYEDIYKYLLNFNLSEKELTNYIIGTLSQFDRIEKPRDLSKIKDRRYLSGYTEEMRDKAREDALSITKEDIRNYGEIFKELFMHDNICTIGNKEEIEKAIDKFQLVETLIEGNY